MKTSQLLEFIRTQRLAVETSVGPGGAPQAALVGIAVTDALELVFDTLATTRKVANLRRNPRVAFVIGGWADGDERTVQYEGIAEEPQSQELPKIKAAYFKTWPESRSHETWPGLIYVRVRPTWIRFSDFNQDPPTIVDFWARSAAQELGSMADPERGSHEEHADLSRRSFVALGAAGAVGSFVLGSASAAGQSPSGDVTTLTLQEAADQLRGSASRPWSSPRRASVESNG